uniref:SPOC domain-containing protein n=1 Tax=Electrophorus electricus TaxID=8005 RepID=A0A4W4G1G8_ELEEL
SQEGENRPKVAHISSGGPLGDPKLDISHVRHPANMDLSRVSRIQSEIASPSYTSPTAITTKSDASPSVKKGPQSLGGPPLRIAQRMRLEASQLEGVARRMTVSSFSDYCLLLALPCGLDQDDVLNQTHALKTGFITYLQAKQAAGIINVPNPGSNQVSVPGLAIFPPCEFSESHLSHLAPDLLNSISSISPHLMIVIASV